MTTYGKIENGQFIPAPYGEPEILISQGYKPFDENLQARLNTNPQQVIIQGDELVDITNTDEYKAKIAAEKETYFSSNFIGISIGYLRKVPKGYSSLVEAMNSALNFVNINGSLPAGLWTIYPKPDFTTVDDVETYLEANSFKNVAMASKDFGTLYVEFMNTWNSQEHAAS